MENETREIKKRTLLSITSGVNLADHFGLVIAAINIMAGQAVYKYQLPDAADQLAPKLIEDFPELDVEVEPMEPNERDEFEANHADLDKTFEVSPYNIDVPEKPFQSLIDQMAKK